MTAEFILKCKYMALIWETLYNISASQDRHYTNASLFQLFCVNIIYICFITMEIVV